MLKEVALNLFESIPHTALNIVDFAKGIVANFTANIGSALLNTVLQIVFFIGVLFVIPWLGHIVLHKHYDISELLAKLKKAVEEGNEKKKNELLHKITIFCNLYLAPMEIIQSWTSDLLTELIRIPILILSFNHPRNFECYIDSGEGGTIKGRLHIGFCEILKFTNPLHSFKRPWTLVGLYIARAVYMIVPLLFPVAVLYFLLPNTFASVVSGLGQWVELQSGTPNLAFFTNMALVFKDIAWDKLVIGGLSENVFAFAFLIIVSVIYTSHFVQLTEKKVSLLDENDEPTGDVEKKLSYEMCSCIIIAIIICLVNVALAMFSGAYLTISYQVNSVGMILLFVILVKEIIATTATCFQKIVKLIMKLKG